MYPPRVSKDRVVCRQFDRSKQYQKTWIHDWINFLLGSKKYLTNTILDAVQKESPNNKHLYLSAKNRCRISIDWEWIFFAFLYGRFTLYLAKNMVESHNIKDVLIILPTFFWDYKIKDFVKKGFVFFQKTRSISDFLLWVKKPKEYNNF